MLVENIYALIARVAFVDFAEQHRQGKSLRHSYLRILRMLTGFLWPAFAGLAVIAGPLVVTLYGEKWVDAALPFSLLCVASLLAMSVAMIWEVFVVCQETARQARLEFVRAAVGLLLFAGGCLTNLAGPAVARIGETAFGIALFRRHLQRMTDTRPRECSKIYFQSAILTILAISPASLVMTLYGWSPHTPVPLLLGAIAVGILAWVGGLRVLRHPLLNEARMVLSHLLPGVTHGPPQNKVSGFRPFYQASLWGYPRRAWNLQDVIGRSLFPE